MSLCTDKFFAQALAASSEVTALVGSRIFNTVDDEINPEATIKLPYILITNNGTINDAGSKDDDFESDYDEDSLSLTIVAKTRVALASLATLVRNTIRNAARANTATDWTALGFEIISYQFEAAPVLYDDMAKAHWQDLTYKCETINLQ